jgi:hypothetical protein
MKRIALLIGCTLPLAACNSDPQVTAENASAQEVARKVEAAGGSGNFVNPGLWRSTVTLQEMSVPGMPPAVAEQMKRAHGQSQSSEQCLTPEQAKRPKEDFFGGRDNCRYEHFSMGGGKIDAVMNCSEDGGTQKMTMAGTYSGNAYQMQMTVQAANAGETAAMGMKMRVEAQRIGECTGKES